MFRVTVHTRTTKQKLGTKMSKLLERLWHLLHSNKTHVRWQHSTLHGDYIEMELEHMDELLQSKRVNWQAGFRRARFQNITKQMHMNSGIVVCYRLGGLHRHSSLAEFRNWLKQVKLQQKPKQSTSVAQQQNLRFLAAMASELCQKM